MTPSLKALQAFEAAARTGSFVAAAAELSVTPAAVGQLVRTLERRLGRQLLLRVHRGIVPSEAGHEVLPRLRAVFEELDAVSRRLAGSVVPPRLTVSVPASIATGWLGRAIAAFVETEGALDVSLRCDEDPVPFAHERIDVRMSYGRFHYRGENTREILLDAVHPVCSPAFLDRHGPITSVEALLAVPLVHTDWGPSSATFPAWSTWLESAPDGGGRHGPHRGSVANVSKVAIDLAIGGLGVALVQGLLASGPVARGELVVAYPHALPLGQPYCLTVAENGLQREVAQRFASWFAEACVSHVARLEDTLPAGSTSTARTR